MENKVTDEEFRKRYYLTEFKLFDGEEHVTFNIVDINTEKKTIIVAVTNRGRISVIAYDLMTDSNGLYFEYGAMDERINVEDFEEGEE
ncbi:MAG: hypothetical protein EOM87_10240 [Clostridia bacterium]|nr:hypothetical protein [Clostridia bacterium]